MRNITRSKSLLFALISLPFIVISFIVFVLILAANTNSRNSTTGEYRTFNNCSELSEWINPNKVLYPNYYYYDRLPVAEDTAGRGSSGDYSSTNVQVSGVDEADSVKTDGEYAYIVSGSYVYIVPVGDGDLKKATSVIKPENIPESLFLNGDKLVVFARTDASSVIYDKSGAELTRSVSNGGVQTSVYIYDISDKYFPQLVRKVNYDGTYQTARMIDGNIYIINAYYPSYYYSNYETVDVTESLPKIADIRGNKEFNESDYALMADCNQVSYYGQQGNNFVSIVAIGLEDEKLSTKVLVGGTQTPYMSKDNLYLTTVVYENLPETPVCDPWQTLLGACRTDLPVDFSLGDVTTQIYKISVEDLNINFKAVGEVKGTLLNQFSMDENSGYFRIATTTNSNGSKNNLYILDQDMNLVGSLEGLAPSETIYSVRFMDDRAYMVTFRQVDPLFVIDLANPRQPEVLGQLKIPGFSSYLHPYDSTHIIGFGRDTEDISDTAAIQKGLKVALFDVTDPENPIEVSKVILGDRGSYSQLLDEHKALLFDREKGLIVFPATLYEKAGSSNTWDYGDVEFEGFVVMNVNLADGLQVKAQIESALTSSIYYYTVTSRAFYVGNVLFTWGGSVLRSNDLTTFAPISELTLDQYVSN